MRLAVQEDLLDGGSIEERFSAAEALQLDGIELWSTALAERLDKARGLSRLLGVGVPVVNVSLRTSLLAADEDERRVTAAELRRLLSLCGKIATIGLVYVPSFGGPRLDSSLSLEDARREARQQLPERLYELARVAVNEGTTLLLEPVCRFESYVINTVAEAAAICRDSGQAGLGVCANLYAMRLEAEDLAHAAQQAGEWLKYLHLSDTGRRLPGLGAANLAAELAALKRGGYDGIIGIEAGVPGQNTLLRRFYARELPPALERLRVALP